MVQVFCSVCAFSSLFNFNEAPRFVAGKVVALNTLVSCSVQTFFSKHCHQLGLWKAGGIIHLQHCHIPFDEPSHPIFGQSAKSCPQPSGNNSAENMRICCTFSSVDCELLQHMFVYSSIRCTVSSSTPWSSRQGLAAFHFRDIYELLGHGVPRNIAQRGKVLRGTRWGI